MNNVEKEFFIRQLTKKRASDKDKSIYDILPEFGHGEIIMYKIIDGMYLSYNDFYFKKTIEKEQGNKFSDVVIEIDYCLDGEYDVTSATGHQKNVTRGENLYYCGCHNAGWINLTNTSYKSMTIFCYLNEIIHSIGQIYGISTNLMKVSYGKLHQKKHNTFVIRRKMNNILNELYEYIHSDSIELIKVKAMELFLLEMSNDKQALNQEKRYYTKTQIDKVNKIKKMIEEEFHKNITIEELSKMENINTTDLKRCFKEMFGDSIYAYKKKYRMKKAMELLFETDYKIYEIVQKIGYSDPGQFTKSFKDIQGMTPTEYRKNFGVTTMDIVKEKI